MGDDHIKSIARQHPARIPISVGILAGWMAIVCVSAVMAVAGEPLGTVPPGAFVLDQGWQMQSSALAGDSPDHAIKIPATSSARGNK